MKNVLTNLENLKSKADKSDNDKLVPVPNNLSKLNDVVKNDVVKKDVSNAKIKNIEDKKKIMKTKKRSLKIYYYPRI